MYLLKTAIPLLSVVLLFSCKASGPLTPNEAFLMARAAARSSDYGILAELISKESKVKIETVSSLFRSMPEERLASIARVYGMSTGSLKNLSHEDYMKMMLMGEQSILKKALNAEIIGIEMQGSRALVKLHNGLSLDFSQEGPYWKLSIENL